MLLFYRITAKAVYLVTMQVTTGLILTLVASRMPSRYTAASRVAPALTTHSKTARCPPSMPMLGINHSQNYQRDTR